MGKHQMITGLKDATGLLTASQRGETYADKPLDSLIYTKLERILGGLNPRMPLNPTFLCRASFVALVDEKRLSWRSYHHFLSRAATQFGRLLVDQQGKGFPVCEGEAPVLSVGYLFRERAGAAVSRLIEVLSHLAEVDQAMYRLAQMRLFTGLRVEQLAELWDEDPVSLTNLWRNTRDRLHTALYGNTQ